MHLKVLERQDIGAGKDLLNMLHLRRDHSEQWINGTSLNYRAPVQQRKHQVKEEKTDRVGENLSQLHIPQNRIRIEITKTKGKESRKQMTQIFKMGEGEDREKGSRCD